MGYTTRLLLSCLLILDQLGANALPTNKTDPIVEAAILDGTFQSPSKLVRPRFRYWVPDASVNRTRLTLDIESAASIGAGGVEVVGYYLYGGAAGDIVPVDWATYGWGTEAWKEVFTTLLQAHKDNDLIMDFALGPSQGQGVPAREGSEGLQWDTRQNVTVISIGESFQGVAPGWGVGSLEAAVLGLVTSSSNISGAAPSLPNESASSEGYRMQNVIAVDSLQDLTDQVGADGTLSFQTPANVTGLHYILFTLYIVPSNLHAQISPLDIKGAQTSPTSFRENGSWTVDHFSTLGAQTTIDYWEKYLLDDGTIDLLQSVGNYAWEDSVEINPAGNLYWTKSLRERFLHDRGYSINKWLPLLTHQNGFTNILAAPATDTPVWFVTDEDDAGNSHIADYRETLGDLYGDYLSTLNSWANDKLGLQFSAQVSYNMAMDMEQNIPLVDAPETESLGFDHSIDKYRQYVGPANLAGKRIISSELGANLLEAYQQTLPGLLWDVKKSVAGGINQFVFHGMPFSGDYPNTTWPGFNTFTYLFSEMHNRHQPAWDFYSDSMDFVARLQFIFQKGVPKRDLAFYSKVTTYPAAQIGTVYWPQDLNEFGYTYEYLSPDDLSLPEAYVNGSILAPNRQAFKAMIVRANDSMTYQGVAKIAEYARAGLPVVFSGGIPSTFISHNASGAAFANQTLEQMTCLSNVHIVPYEGLAQTIADLGIRPASKPSANRTWYTYWRRDDAARADYVYLYNDASAVEEFAGGFSEGTVEFASTGTPYIYDAWTGAQTRVLDYSQTADTTSLSLQLAGNQSTIVAFHDESPSAAGRGRGGAPSPAFAGPPPPPPPPQPQPQPQPQPSRPAAEIILKDWTLTVERWDPPSNLYDADAGATKTNTSLYALPTLTSWQDLAGLQNASGRGFYSARFTWPFSSPSSSSCGKVFLDFGALFHTARATLNAHPLPPLDPTWAKADISRFLREGENTIDVVVATPLYNALWPLWGRLRSSGLGAGALAGLESADDGVGTSPRQEYGLVGEVKVVF